MSTASVNLIQIKKHFQAGKSLTHMECTGLYGTHRLAANVHILRYQHKMNIVHQRKTASNGLPYLFYWLEKEEPKSSSPA